MRVRRSPLIILLSLLGIGCSSGLAGPRTAPATDAARCQSLAAQMGVRLGIYSSEHFLVLSSTDSASMGVTGQLLDQVQSRFYDSFSRAGFSLAPLTERLVCVCLNSYTQLDAYGRQADGAEVSWMDGYYSYQTNRVAVVRGAGQGNSHARSAAPPAAKGALHAAPRAEMSTARLNQKTVTHELAHQLAFNSGLQNRDVAYPFWVTEGLATNFESDSVGSCGLGSQTSVYLSRLIQLRSTGRLSPLQDFVGLTQISGGSPDATRDTYAQAWGLFKYLLTCRRRQLQQYMAGMSRGSSVSDPQSLRRRFADAFGPIGPLEKDFQRFVDQQSSGRAR